MNKKKYLTLDATRFGFKMFRTYSFFIFKLSIVIGLLLWGIISLIYIIQHGSVTYIDFSMLFNAFHNLISGEFTPLLENLKPSGLTHICTAIWIVILIGITEIIAIKIALALYDNQPISFKNIFTCWKKIPTYFALALLLFYISNLASNYLIGSGFLIEALSRLYKYFLIDKNTNVSQAFIHSWKISKNHLIDLCMAWAIMICLVIVSIALATILCISIMNHIVIFIIACYAAFTCLFINASTYAFFYRKLLEETQQTPANIINENYQQIPKLDQTTIQS